MKIGYARVSTKEQDLLPQVKALKKAGCEKIYSEKVSGKDTARPQLELMMSEVSEGDQVLVWKLDRLGRSLIDLINLIKRLEQRGVHFKSIEDSIDTKTSIGKFTFYLFGALAEYERSLISERTKFGLDAAKAQGRFGGRPRGIADKDKLIAEAVAAYYEKGVSMTVISDRVGRSRSTCYRYYAYVVNTRKDND